MCIIVIVVGLSWLIGAYQAEPAIAKSALDSYDLVKQVTALLPQYTIYFSL